MTNITSDLLTLHTNKITADTALVDSINSAAPAHISYVTIKQKIYHILHNLHFIPTCISPGCNNPVNWCKQNQWYTNTCGYACSNKITASSSKAKKQKTNQDRYGGNAPACSSLVTEKMKQTNILLYGDQYKQINADKSKNAIMDLFGVTNVSQLDFIKEQKIQTSYKRFGTLHPTQSNAVRDKIKNTIAEKYGVSNINQLHISLKTLEMLNDYTFLHDSHIKLKKTLTEIALNLGVDIKTVSNALKKHGIEIKIHNNKISIAEQELFDFIRSACPDATQSNRSILTGKELDVYVPSIQLAIEYCGLYWHSTAHSRIDRLYHLHKTSACKEQGIRLITLFENEWIQNKEVVKKKLLDIIQHNPDPRIYARNTNIVELTKKVADEFHDTNHLQGKPTATTINIGLMHGVNLAATMSFVKRMNCYELVRYSTSCKVVGGFSKLLTHAKACLDTNEIISFADLRWSNGDMYVKTGWKLVSILPPDYKYVEGNTLSHKFNYRHKHLHKKLTNYDPTLSEYQNTKKHNIHRIYDCGLLKFSIKTNKS